MKQITDRQKQILTFISDYQESNSYPPTVREIGEHFGVSIRAVQDHITALQKKGFITQTQKKSRSIKVITDVRQKGQDMFLEKVPLIGTIAAGKPLLCEENYEGYVTLTEPFIRPGKNYFALHVRGESMINAGILEGDLAVIDDAITLKRYFKEPTRIRLQPENPAFHPIYCQDVRIVGVLANLVRTY